MAADRGQPVRAGPHRSDQPPRRAPQHRAPGLALGRRHRRRLRPTVAGREQRFGRQRTIDGLPHPLLTLNSQRQIGTS